MIALPDRLAVKLAIALAAALMVALLVHDRNRWKAKTGEYSALLAAERSAHSATVAGYRAAAERARREDAENLARVKAGQAAINERTRNDFESRIAAARARSAGLQHSAQAGAADPGGGRAARLPGLSAPSERVAEAAGEDGFPFADRLIATEQAIQLDELIKWVKAQAEIEMSSPQRKLGPQED